MQLALRWRPAADRLRPAAACSRAGGTGRSAHADPGPAERPRCLGDQGADRTEGDSGACPPGPPRRNQGRAALFGRAPLVVRPFSEKRGSDYTGSRDRIRLQAAAKRTSATAATPRSSRSPAPSERSATVALAPERSEVDCRDTRGNTEARLSRVGARCPEIRQSRDAAGRSTVQPLWRPAPSSALA
jgi:hypothetical protein